MFALIALSFIMFGCHMFAATGKDITSTIGVIDGSLVWREHPSVWKMSSSASGNMECKDLDITDKVRNILKQHLSAEEIDALPRVFIPVCVNMLPLEVGDQLTMFVENVDTPPTKKQRKAKKADAKTANPDDLRDTPDAKPLHATLTETPLPLAVPPPEKPVDDQLPAQTRPLDDSSPEKPISPPAKNMLPGKPADAQLAEQTGQLNDPSLEQPLNTPAETPSLDNKTPGTPLEPGKPVDAQLAEQTRARDDPSPEKPPSPPAETTSLDTKTPGTPLECQQPKASTDTLTTEQRKRFNENKAKAEAKKQRKTEGITA